VSQKNLILKQLESIKYDGNCVSVGFRSLKSLFRWDVIRAALVQCIVHPTYL